MAMWLERSPRGNCVTTAGRSCENSTRESFIVTATARGRAVPSADTGSFIDSAVHFPHPRRRSRQAPRNLDRVVSQPEPLVKGHSRDRAHRHSVITWKTSIQAISSRGASVRHPAELAPGPCHRRHQRARPRTDRLRDRAAFDRCLHAERLGLRRIYAACCCWPKAPSSSCRPSDRGHAHASSLPFYTRNPTTSEARTF